MEFNARWSNISRPIQLIWLSIKLHYTALISAFQKDGIVALTHLSQIHDEALAKLFLVTSNGFIAYENTTVLPTLFTSARGTILELGVGAGNQIQRYNPALVSVIYGIDPNPNFGPAIISKAQKCGLEDKYKFLACGVEDSDVLLGEGVAEGSLDTIISIQVLCAVHDPNSVMREIYKLVKPGGSFIFWEHTNNHSDTATSLAQRCLNPAWSTFIGCHLTRDLKTAILLAGEWDNPSELLQDEDPYTTLPRIWGVLRKKV